MIYLPGTSENNIVVNNKSRIHSLGAVAAIRQTFDSDIFTLRSPHTSW